MNRPRRYHHPRVDLAGFNIAVVGADGSRHTMLGFKTVAEPGSSKIGSETEAKWTTIVDARELDASTEERDLTMRGRAL